MNDGAVPQRSGPIGVGDAIPSLTLKLIAGGQTREIDTASLLGDGTSVLFGVPGAFTPTCSGRHLPGFVEQASALQAKGVARIVCMAVNDAFVLSAWGEAQGVGDAVGLLADGNGDFAGALGLQKDARAFGLGLRCKRFAMIVDGAARVRWLAIDESGLEATGAEKVLAAL